MKLERAQYFISMPVIGHILGALWVLALGIYLDDQSDPDKMKMYEHSYGNRLRKNLRDGETGRITYSPYLFEPYFSQYESWRDKMRYSICGDPQMLYLFSVLLFKICLR
ncbi:MAG: hypothetical protein II614_01415, partial [Ruminococcus sp.]|nr:hypothetical protein [Ruminococcus sp.]